MLLKFYFHYNTILTSFIRLPFSLKRETIIEKFGSNKFILLQKMKRQLYRLRTFLVVSFILFTTQAIHATLKVPDNLTGGTYFTDKQSSLDIVTERTPTVDGVIEFSIEVDKGLPQKSVVLSINAYDVDEERGETNKVFFNGQYIGKLSGTNNSWNTTIFEFDTSYVKTGSNKVKILITDSSPSGRIKWSSKIDWGQLLIDGGAADQGNILGQIVKYNNQDDQRFITAKEVIVTAVTDVAALASGDFRLETTMLDISGNAVVSTILNKKLTEGQTLELRPQLKYGKDLPTGTYRLTTSLFFKLRGMQVQQGVNEVFFEHFENKGKTDPDILLKHSLSAVNVKEDALPVTIDLADLFIDEDTNRFEKAGKKIGLNSAKPQFEISLAVFKNNNPHLLNATIEDQKLTLMFLPDQFGEAVVTIRGTLKSKHLDEFFAVTVDPVGDSPVIITPLSDIITGEDSTPSMIDIKELFQDVDLAGPALPDLSVKSNPQEGNPENQPAVTKYVETSVLSNTNESLVSTDIKDNTLIVTYQKDQSGSAILVIRGTSEGETVDTQFKVTVTAVDDPPRILEGISDINVVENAEPLTVDIKRIFFDIDGIPQKSKNASTETVAQKEQEHIIIKSITSNTNPELITTQLKDDRLNISFRPGQWGNAVVTLRGDSGDKSVEDSFNVIVSQVGAPLVTHPLKDIEVDEDAPDMSIDLDSVFSAPEIVMHTSNGKNRDSTINRVISTSLVSHSGPSLVSAKIEQDKLLLSFKKDQSGVAVLKIRGTSRGKHSDDIFEIRVKAVDDPPVIDNRISKIEVDEDSDEKTIDLGTVFTDVDNDDSMITHKILTDYFKDLLTVKLDGNRLLINFEENRNGALTLVLQGTSNQKTVKTNIEISIKPVDDPPIVAEAIDDIVVYADANSREYDLGPIFTDIDDSSTSIRKTVKFNSNPDLVETNISANVLTVNFKKSQTGSADIELMGETNGAEVTTDFSILVNPKPFYLYSYVMAGSRQIPGYTSTLNTTLGVGITLDRYLDQLSAEIEFSKGLDKHSSNNSISGVGYKTETEIDTVGVYLTYPVFTVNLMETQWLPFDSIILKAKAGLVNRMEHTVSKPDNDFLGIKKSDMTIESINFSPGMNITLPLVGSSGTIIDVMFIGKNIWNLNLGYRFFF